MIFRRSSHPCVALVMAILSLFFLLLSQSVSLSHGRHSWEYGFDEYDDYSYVFDEDFEISEDFDYELEFDGMFEEDRSEHIEQQTHSLIDAPVPAPGEFPQPSLERFPRFARAKGFEVVLEAGDMLYLPIRWWHWVFSEDQSLAVNYWTSDGDAASSPAGCCATARAEPAFLRGDDAQGMTAERYAEFVRRNQPFVLRGGAASVPAVSRWTDEHLATTHRGNEVPAWGWSPTGTFYPVRRPWLANGTVQMHRMEPATLKQLVNYVREHPGRPVGANIEVEEGSSLHADLRFPSFLDSSNARQSYLWYHAGGTSNTGLHYDEFENILVQIRGRKRVFLFPPSETRFLYRGRLPTWVFV